MEEYRHNFKDIAQGRGPSPLNPMECAKDYHLNGRGEALGEFCNRFLEHVQNKWLSTYEGLRTYPALVYSSKGRKPIAVVGFGVLTSHRIMDITALSS